ncbi:hypothetical protein JFT59_17870 [Pseudomonas sp. MF6784]|uniref:hypothetical protein n=1 Tax=Pseudomonas sp. MF6784 TaxID=2797535 RepID=UPI0018E773D9|nr:hypothetical protein [Pseudomonas sp. MF6784]MBJ2253070.1 hypothetical protein [Pseudomonas sp. MF6784]
MQDLISSEEVSRAASLVGEGSIEKPPARLLHTLNELGEGAFKSLFGDEVALNRAGNSFFNEFPSIYNYLRRGVKPTENEFVEWVSLFAWFKRQLAEWAKQNDDKDISLTALLLISVFFQVYTPRKSLWKLLSDDFSVSEEIVSNLVNLLAGVQISDYETTMMQCPELKLAEDVGDWLGMDEALHSLDFPAPTLFQKSATEFLEKFSPLGLQKAASSHKQILVVLHQQMLMSKARALRAASETDNTLFRFATLSSLLTRGCSDSDKVESSDLVNFLNVVSQNPHEWLMAVKMMNATPDRWSELSGAISSFLASCDTAALKVFFSSVVIKSCNARKAADERKQLTAFLKAFYEQASSESRELAFSVLYEKWLEWCFETKQEGKHLFQVNFSNIDFALIVYAKECFEISRLLEVIDKLEKEIWSLHLKWFESVLSCKTTWFMLHSKLIVYQGARDVGSVSDWTGDENKALLKRDNSYLALKWR